MSTAALTLHTAAAEALVAALPTPSTLKPVPAPGRSPAAGRSSFTATYVGALSAEMGLSLTGPFDMAGAAGAPVSVADILRPAFEAAASVLGAGVLGEIHEDPSPELFGDAQTVVFDLNEGPKAEGVFAIRIREGGAPGNGIYGPVGSEKLNRINNVEMSLTVEIGRTRMSVRDVLGLEPGAVIELDRSAGAPADVLLNGRLIAHGEVVVVDQDYAVRITKILDVAEGAL
ncbi:MAG: flagellar motor switch protein FliN [Arthrobacter sp.]